MIVSWIMEEIRAVGYIIIGLLLLFIPLFFADLWQDFWSKVWKSFR